MLADRHRLLIEQSAISPEVAQRRGYATVQTRQEVARLGFPDYQQRVPALLVPIHSVHGGVVTHQLRPDRPRANEKGKALKYETKAGGRMALDCHPDVRPELGNPEIPLLVTEGTRKADAAISAGLPAIALLGVDCWRGTNEHGGKVALPDWDAVALNGRTIYLGFDSDVIDKVGVRRALGKLKRYLESRDANVKILRLPHAPDGSKQGVDDFLAAGHTLGELYALETDEPLDRAAGPGASVTKLDLAAMVGVEPDPPAWVWHGYLERGTVAQLHGNGGLGKSLVALGLTLAVIRGGDFLGWPCRRGNALYLDAENPQRLIHRRVAGFGLTVAEAARLTYLRADAPALQDEEAAEDYLVEQINEAAAILVILDSQRGLWGGDENDQAAVRPWYQMMRRVAERTDAVLVVVHHDNRRGDYSGSSDLNASVDTRLHLKRPKDYDEEQPDTGQRVLVHGKARATAEQPTIPLTIGWADGLFTIEPTDPAAAAVGQLSGNQRAAAAYVRRIFGETGQPVSAHQVADHLGVNVRSVRRWRDELASVRIAFEDGLLRPTDDPDSADIAMSADTRTSPPVRATSPHESTNPGPGQRGHGHADTETCPTPANPHEHRDCARTDTDTPTGEGANGRAHTPEALVGALLEAFPEAEEVA